MKQLFALLLVIVLIVSCAAVCTAVLTGDVNSDGAVNMKDVLTLRLYLSGKTAAFSPTAADGNGDGLVNMKDVLWLRRRLVNDRSATTTTKATKKTTTTAVTTATSADPLPAESEELCGVWIAYYEVESLLKPTVAATKAALDSALDTCKAAGINTVFFHARANSDAYYDSAIFPVVPKVKTLLAVGFDPFDYALNAAHSRGIAFHAWLNPYRVGNAENAVCTDTFTFGGKVYYSPASETVKKTLLSGIEEILKKYAVDGIHFDDYFYPSGVPKTAQKFDLGYTAASGSLADFRRAHVTDFVKRTCALTHSLNPRAQFGISPAGNVETDVSALYADVKTWLSTPDCVDYLCPQLYYGFENSAAPFADTVAEWNALARTESVKLYVGLAMYKAGLREDVWAGEGKTEWVHGGNILARQVQTLRQIPDISGFVLFSYRYMTEAGFDDTCDKTVVKKELAALKKVLATST